LIQEHASPGKNPGILFNNDRPWKTWEKLLFRFFFTFLSLQVLTQDFMGNLFGGSLFVWTLGETIFTRPCRWLNEHFFHFKYLAQTWTTFSGALHTIRDIVYLLLSILSCIVWTTLDRRRTNYNKLFYWFSQALIMVLSCIVFTYGILKVFPVQMAGPSFADLETPVGNLRPFDLLWTTYGYGSPYQTFTGIFEAGSAILILFNRTRVTGLLMIASIMINVIMLNYTFQIGVLMLSFYILLVTLFLLTPFAGQLVRFFFSRQEAILTWNGYVPSGSLKTKIPRVVAAVLICSSFLANTKYVYSVYERREGVKRSRQYSLVKNYIVNNDTLRLIDNDTLCWRYWSEKTTGGKRYATITFMKPGAAKTYTMERDTVRHILSLQALDRKDTTILHFNCTDISKTGWRLEGLVRRDTVKIDLQRIDIDTVFQLLRTRRTIITFDDETDQE
jgi:hypothetical protein